MDTYSVDLEIQGKPFTVDVQANSDKEAMDFAAKQASDPAGVKQIISLAAENHPAQQGFLRKAWEALKVPEAMSREGLGKMAAAVPTPDNPVGAAGVLQGTPRVLADTLAEAAPSFVSRGAILTSGGLAAGKALAPAIKAVGGALGRGAEAISGLEYKTPGVLAEAARDPGLLFGPGRATVGKKYEEAFGNVIQNAIKNTQGQMPSVPVSTVRPEFARATSPKELLDAANKALDEGSLTAREALIARQTLDAIKKTLPRFSYQEMRNAFDEIAKTATSEVDPQFAQAVKSEALRQLFPQNKLGGTSIAKGILGILGGGGPLVAMSPLAQGTAATAAGLAARGAGAAAQAPVNVGGMTGALIDAINRMRQGGRR